MFLFNKKDAFPYLYLILYLHSTSLSFSIREKYIQMQLIHIYRQNIKMQKSSYYFYFSKIYSKTTKP